MQKNFPQGHTDVRIKKRCSFLVAVTASAQLTPGALCPPSCLLGRTAQRASAGLIRRPRLASLSRACTWMPVGAVSCTTRAVILADRVSQSSRITEPCKKKKAPSVSPWGPFLKLRPPFLVQGTIGAVIHSIWKIYISQTQPVSSLCDVERHGKDTIFF